MVIVLMGVSGSGKTTVGRRLAAELGWPFRDADEFHPAANVGKMTAGQPLTEADRAPWLAAIRACIDGCLARGENAVVTCSALRERHRRELVADPARVKLVCLDGDDALLRERLARRRGHFMKAGMLASQRADFEPPVGALVLDVALTPAQLVAGIRRALFPAGAKQEARGHAAPPAEAV
jgi:gluconokinase